MNGMNLPTAKENEVYAARVKINFGNGEESLIVIYPKNKLISRHLANKAIEKLKELENKE